MADLLNHATDPNVAFAYVNSGNRLKLWTLQPVALGQQLLTNYGENTAYSSSTFFGFYGITDPRSLNSRGPPSFLGEIPLRFPRIGHSLSLIHI